MPRMPIQDEPESTVGRKPPRVEQHGAETPGATRSGATIRREKGDETEAGSELRERERGEPPPARGLEE